MSADWFSVLSEAQWTALGVIVAASVAVGGFIAWWLDKRRKAIEAPPNVQVDAIHHGTRSEPGGLVWPSLSVTLKNIGRQTAVIDEIECEVLSRWPLGLIGAKALHVQATPYAITIAREQPLPQRITQGVVHAIAPDGVDRLQLDFSAQPAQAFEEVFVVRVSFRYGSRQTTPFLQVLTMPDDSASNPMYFWGEYQAKLASVPRLTGSGQETMQYGFLRQAEGLARLRDPLNRAVAADIVALQVAYLSPRVQEFVARSKTSAAPPPA